VPSKATDKTDRFIRKISGARGRGLRAARGKGEAQCKSRTVAQKSPFSEIFHLSTGRVTAPVYAARDLEGHVWSFGQSIGKVSRADAGRASGLTMGGMR